MDTKKMSQKDAVREYRNQGMPESEAIKLVSMKRSKEENKKLDKQMSAPSAREEYPYGTRLELESEQIEKLGLGSMKAGDKVSISAHGHVQTHSEHQSSGESPRRSITLQVTHMGVKHHKVSK